MDYIEKALEKLKEWARKLVEALLGPEAQPEPEPIPVPVREPQRRRQKLLQTVRCNFWKFQKLLRIYLEDLKSADFKSFITVSCSASAPVQLRLVSMDWCEDKLDGKKLV